MKKTCRIQGSVIVLVIGSVLAKANAEGVLPTPILKGGGNNLRALEGQLPTPDVGAAVRGANRRVITNPAYGCTAVEGIFTVPDIYVPGGPYYTTTSQGQLIPAPGPPFHRANSKPIFYLGSKREGVEDSDPAFEVDGGVQYEWKAAEYMYLDGTEQKVGIAPPAMERVFDGKNSDFAFGNGGVKIQPVGWRAGPGTANPGVNNLAHVQAVCSTSRAMKCGEIRLRLILCSHIAT